MKGCNALRGSLLLAILVILALLQPFTAYAFEFPAPPLSTHQPAPEPMAGVDYVDGEILVKFKNDAKDKKKVNLRTVQEILWHADITTTPFYTHVVTSEHPRSHILCWFGLLSTRACLQQSTVCQGFSQNVSTEGFSKTV